ncbi:uncharacterized protein LOC130782719 [Actinidia eriantha]|uniref:uncharacterized protein LOC130782719 n=1 Tax=Actinidia eriantha TaxID=165200 RepID=UPI00258F9352|nr:uncharacterized protein LOC130782719 [Actinidia eriantha]
MASSQIQIEAIENSLGNLIKSWNTRQKWKVIFNPSEQNNQRSRWRTRLSDFLESTPMRVIFISLLLVDLVLTALELSSSLLSCKPRKHTIEQVWYHRVGIAILGVLGLKSIALAISLGCSYFRRPGYVMDGMVVVAALVLEVLLERKGGGLLVVVSLWSVVRVVESAFQLSDEAIQAQIKVIVEEFEALREENGRLLEIIANKDKIIEELQEELEKRKHLKLDSNL